MEACGTASEKGGSQYGCKYSGINIDNNNISWTGEGYNIVHDGEEQCDIDFEDAENNINNNNVVIPKESTYKRGPWTKMEDQLLIKVIGDIGSNDWVKIEMLSGLNRTSKSCRLRWKNHLQPNLKKGSFSFQEERDVIIMHYRFGNKWSLMAKRIPGRSDNEIKNFWHSRIKKCKKRGLPLYPDWCLQEDHQTLNDSQVCMMSDVQITPVPDSILEQQLSVLPNHDMFQYYPPSTSETSMINASCSITSPRTDFCLLQGDCGQTALHNVSPLPSLNAFNNSSSAPLSPMDLSPRPQLCPSFQQFLSPRPKTSQPSFTFSTAIFSTPTPAQISSPHGSCSSSPQVPYNTPPTNMSSLRDSNGSIFETSKCPPVLSLPSGRFNRNTGATSALPPSIKTNYNQGQRIHNSASSDSSFHMNALTHSSSTPNLLNMHSPLSPLSLRKSSKESMLPTNQSTMTAAALHSFSSSPNLELEPLVLQYLDQNASLNSTTKDSSSCTWKSSTLLQPPPIQSHATELLSIPETSYDSNEYMSENYTDLLDTLLQDAQIDSCLSDLQLVEQYLFNQQLNTQHLYQKILRGKQCKNITTANKGISSSRKVSRNGSSNCSSNMETLLHENIEMNVPTSEILEPNDPLKEQGKRKLKMADQSFIEMSSPIESLPKESLKRHRTMSKCDHCSSILNIESDQTPSGDIIVGQYLKDEELVTSGKHVSSSDELGNQNETYQTTSDSWKELLINTKYSGDDCFFKNIEAYEDIIANNDFMGDATTETLLLDSQDDLHGISLCYPY